MTGITVIYKSEKWDLIKDYDIYLCRGIDYGVAIQNIHNKPKMLIISLPDYEVRFNFLHTANYAPKILQYVDFDVLEAMKLAIEAYEEKDQVKYDLMASKYMD